MKKLLVVVAVLTFTMGSAFAQKGSWYLGTSAMTSATALGEDPTAFVTGFMMDKEGDAKTSVFGIAPEAGYFVSDKLSVGLGVGFNLTSEKANSDADAVKTTAFGVNPYVRYFLISKGNFGFYLQGGLSYVSSKLDVDGADAYNIFYVGINPGVSYKLTDNFGINASFGNLGYTDFGKNDADESVSNFGLNVDMTSLRFGLFWAF